MNVSSAIRSLFDAAILDDPYPTLARLRSEVPVFRIPGTQFHVVTRWDLVAECQMRVADFSSNLTAVLVSDSGGGVREYGLDLDRTGTHVLATGDDPVHRLHRKLVLPTLVAKRIAALEGEIESRVNRLWAAWTPEGIEWMSAIADGLPLELVARLIGLPPADVSLLRELSYASTAMLGGVTTEAQLPRALTAAVELAGYLHDAFRAARRAPNDDLLGDLARACAAGDLADHVAVLILVQLVGAGGESTAGLLGNAAHRLACDPDLQHLVRADPDRIDAFLDEVLRTESPFRGHLRHVVTDTTLAGVELPAGAHLLLSWGAANRDPAVFPEPDSFQLGRPNIRSHMAFGRGTHFCVGAALARLEARVCIRALLAGTTDLRVGVADRLPSIFVRRFERLDLVRV